MDLSLKYERNDNIIFKLCISEYGLLDNMFRNTSDKKETIKLIIINKDSFHILYPFKIIYIKCRIYIILNMDKTEIMDKTNEFNELLYKLDDKSNTLIKNVDIQGRAIDDFRDKLNALAIKMEETEKKIDLILEKINNNHEICEKMGDHIEFVETTYDIIRKPMNYLTNKVNFFANNEPVELPSIKKLIVE